MFKNIIKSYFFLILILLGIFAIFSINFLNTAQSSIDCCYNECQPTDPARCDGVWTQKCDKCDSDPYYDWCDQTNCADSGQICLNGACVAGTGCTIICATGPGCRYSLANGAAVAGECCSTGDCYDCKTGWSWSGSTCVSVCADNDNDGYGNPAAITCAKPQLDCDDSNININPGATEICDGADNNCDGQTDEGCDNDNDDYCACGQTFAYGSDLTATCLGTNTTDAAAIANTCDCKDNNAAINLAAAEICNNILDDDCDANIDCADADCASNAACTGATTCSDGTETNTCSTASGAPWYCDNTKNLIENCTTCGCSGSWVCSIAGTFCCDNLCNGSCSPAGCTVGKDPDCGSAGCCGDGTCDTGENNTSCPADCPITCSDECAAGSFGCSGLNAEWTCGEAGNGDGCLDKITAPCGSGKTCNPASGVCELSVAGNAKLLSKYSNKEVFLISDNNWKDVLPLVSVSIWTEPNGTVKKYPALVYHDEAGAIDMDSTIHFMQLYPPSRLTAIGAVPAKLTNLLVAVQPLGAGMNAGNISNINTSDYFSYWSNYNDVVYVEDNYELALLASTYASLINAPLVIAGTANDTNGVFSGKKTICVGAPPRTCDEQYNLTQIQDKYVQTANNIDAEDLNKIIVTNANDWGYYNTPFGPFQSEKSGDSIQEIFGKNSIISPFLSAAKHEVILTASDAPNVKSDCQDSGQTFNCSVLRDKIKQKVNQLNLPDIDIGRKHSSNNLILYNNGATQQIQDSYYGVFSFDVYNNKIIWIEEDRIEKITAPAIGINVESDYNLKSYDALTKQTEILHSFVANILQEIAIYDNNIVWLTEDQSAGVFSIALFNINTKTSQTIYSTANQIRNIGGKSILVNNNYIIWNEEDFDPITFQQKNVLKEYDILTKTTNQLYVSNGKNQYIDATDNLLVWQDNDFFASTKTMYYMKFSDHNITGFNNPSDNINVMLATDSDFIIWSEWNSANSNYVFHKYDIAAGAVVNNIISLPQNYYPAYFDFYNNKVYMYSGDNSNNKNVVAYDINTGQKQDITPLTDTANKYGLEVHLGKIVWSEVIEKAYMFKNGYITIIAGPGSIPYSDSAPADKRIFSSIYRGDYLPDLAYGRIVGLTSSDVSSYIARAVFFNDMAVNNKAAFFASEANNYKVGTKWLDDYACPIFSNSGYILNSCIRLYGIDQYPYSQLEAEYYKNADFVYYFNHGSSGGINISYADLPYMNNTFIDTMACSTVKMSVANANFSIRALRKGSIGYMGAIEVSGMYNTAQFMAHSVYYENLPIGFAFAKYTNYDFDTLLGDPTLVIGKTLVNQPLMAP